MNKDNIIKELNELVHNKLIGNYSIQHNIIEIYTLENNKLDIETDFRTYYMLKNISDISLNSNIGKYYESFEQILSHLSNEYNSSFNKSLYDKLLELKKDQENDNKY